MQLQFSFIIPVFNRPDEIQELLHSFTKLKTQEKFEIVIIEDGSHLKSEQIVNTFKKDLNIAYYFKENSGPGDSRNYGMQRAKGNYFIILDSDCILPELYLTEVINGLSKNYLDCYGGPDAAHQSFSTLQKAINFSMTSLITTGGIRGNKKSVDAFQPRSFNMGISKKAFETSEGFGNIHPGEDPDLSIRLWKLGFKTGLISNAYVYHKRRISWKKFYQQVYNFGLVRPILNSWYPESKKITYWFPTLFSLGFILSIILLFFGFRFFILIYIFYFLLALLLALISTKNVLVSLLSIMSIIIQFFGYGYGYLKSTWVISVLNNNPEKIFPNLFFKKHAR